MDCSFTHTVHTTTHTDSQNIRLWPLRVWLFLGSNYSAKMIWQVVSEDMKFAPTCSLISHVFCQHPFNMRFSGFQKTKSDRHKNRCWVLNKQNDQVHSMFKIPQAWMNNPLWHNRNGKYSWRQKTQLFSKLQDCSKLM